MREYTNSQASILDIANHFVWTTLRRDGGLARLCGDRAREQIAGREESPPATEIRGARETENMTPRKGEP